MALSLAFSSHRVYLLRLRRNRMSSRKFLIGIAIAWLIAITLLHAAFNLHWFTRAAKTGVGASKFRIGFLPGHVPSHLPGDRFHQQTHDRRRYFRTGAVQWLAGIEGGVSVRLYAGDVHPRADGHGAARAGRADQDRLSRPPRRHGHDGAQGLEHLPHRGSARQEESPCPTAFRTSG